MSSVWNSAHNTRTRLVRGPTEYQLPCLFLGDPQARPSVNAPVGVVPRKLLQPLQLLDVLRFEMKKDPAAGLVYGMLVETVFSMLTLVSHCKKVMHRVWAYFQARLAFTMAAFNMLVQWHGLQPHASGFVPLSIAEFSL